VRQQARCDLLVESRKHSAVKLLRQIPAIGLIRAALLVALLQPPQTVFAASDTPGLRLIPAANWRLIKPESVAS
jgi:hypothetical protein